MTSGANHRGYEIRKKADLIKVHELGNNTFSQTNEGTGIGTDYSLIFFPHLHSKMNLTFHTWKAKISNLLLGGGAN